MGWKRGRVNVLQKSSRPEYFDLLVHGHVPIVREGVGEWEFSDKHVVDMVMFFTSQKTQEREGGRGLGKVPIYEDRPPIFLVVLMLDTAQWYSAGLLIGRPWVRSPVGGAGEFSSLSTCADSYFGIRSTPLLPQ